MATANLPGNFPRTAGAIAIAIGATVLLGWTCDSTILTGVVPGLVPMNPATAVACILLGASLWLLRRVPEDRSRWAYCVGCGCALTAGLVGLSKLCEHFLGWSTGPDSILFHERLLKVA